MPKIILVARVGSPHGVHGDLKLHLFLEQSDLIHQFKKFYWRHPKGSWTIAPEFSFYEKGHQLLIHFKDSAHREQAGQKYTHTELGVERSELPDLPPHQFYWEDLIGLSVYNQEGQCLGQILRLMDLSGAKEVLVIQGKEGKEILIPFVLEHFIISVDLPAQRLIVDWPFSAN